MEVFDQTIQDLLAEMADVDLDERSQALGLNIRSGRIVIPFFNRPHYISTRGVAERDGTTPTPAVATVLLNYALRNTQPSPPDTEILSFRDFSGAGPLVVSFANNTNHLIAGTFAGRLQALETACRDLGGEPAESAASADLYMKFQALPGVPQYLSFNDQDDDFPAQAQLFFQRSAENYLDLKSLFVLGTYLAGSLIKFASRA